MTEILQPLNFPLAVVLGALAGLLMQQFCAKKKGVDRVAGEWFAVFALPLGVFFGHLLYAGALYNAQEGDPTVTYLFTPWRGGFMFWGVFIGCAGAALLACLIRKEKALPLLDTVAVGLIVLVIAVRLAAPLDVSDGVSQGFGRPMDELLEAFGLEPAEGARYTPLFFPPEIEYPEDLCLSVWLLEAVWAGVILAMLLAGLKDRPAGRTAAMAMVLYSAGQILLEFLREDQHPKWLYVRVSQLAAAIALFGLLLYATIRRRMRPLRAILTWCGFLAAAGLVVFMAFMIDKPLMITEEPIFFPHWVIYAVIAQCAVGMGLLTWQAIVPRGTKEAEQAAEAKPAAPVSRISIPLRGGKSQESQFALRSTPAGTALTVKRDKDRVIACSAAGELGWLEADELPEGCTLYLAGSELRGDGDTLRGLVHLG